MKLIHTAATTIVLGATGIVTANAATFPSYIGQLATAESPDRTIVINPGTRYVNVTQGERVKFVANGREFTVDFDGASHNFDLGQLAPERTIDHEVTAYVDRNPIWLPNILSRGRRDTALPEPQSNRAASRKRKGPIRFCERNERKKSATGNELTEDDWSGREDLNLRPPAPHIVTHFN